MRCLIFDTETTGLVGNSVLRAERQPKIIEFCGILIDDSSGEIIMEVDTLVRPNESLEPIITKITGLTDNDLKSAPTFKDVEPDITSILEECEALVAHNLTFDLSMLEVEYGRIKKPLPTPEEKICTVEATEHIYGRRMKLTDLHNHLLGSHISGAHRARIDVLALKDVFMKLRKEGEI